MIRGLTWANVGWIGLFSSLLALSATADGYLKLNYGLISVVGDNLNKSYQNLVKASSKAANELDEVTQTRYGFDPFDTRLSNCATTPNSTAVLTQQDLTKLSARKPTDRASMIKTLGEPFCKEVSGHEIWMVGSDQKLQVQYNPLKYQLLGQAKPLPSQQ